MTINEFMAIPRLLQFTNNQLPLQMQLGIPKFVTEDNRLYVVFRPHVENCESDSFTIYSSRFTLKIEYPSGKISFFEDKKCNTECISRLDLSWYLAEGREWIREIYAECDRILESYDIYHATNDVVLKKYHTTYLKYMRAFGLENSNLMIK